MTVSRNGWPKVGYVPLHTFLLRSAIGDVDICNMYNKLFRGPETIKLTSIKTRNALVWSILYFSPCTYKHHQKHPFLASEFICFSPFQTVRFIENEAHSGISSAGPKTSPFIEVPTKRVTCHNQEPLEKPSRSSSWLVPSWPFVPATDLPMRHQFARLLAPSLGSWNGFAWHFRWRFFFPKIAPLQQVVAYNLRLTKAHCCLVMFGNHSTECTIYNNHSFLLPRRR